METLVKPCSINQSVRVAVLQSATLR